jgi:hypothetical protein
LHTEIPLEDADDITVELPLLISLGDREKGAGRSVANYSQTSELLPCSRSSQSIFLLLFSSNQGRNGQAISQP